MAGKTAIGQFLKGRNSTQREAAQVIGVTQSVFSQKAQGFTPWEVDKLAKHYKMSDYEIKNVFHL